MWCVDMSILIKLNYQVYKKKKDKKKKIIIIIPKKYIKKAVNRNKIRRRIKAVLNKKKIYFCVVKYLYNSLKSYQLIQEKIEQQLNIQK